MEPNHEHPDLYTIQTHLKILCYSRDDIIRPKRNSLSLCTTEAIYYSLFLLTNEHYVNDSNYLLHISYRGTRCGKELAGRQGRVGFCHLSDNSYIL